MIAAAGRDYGTGPQSFATNYIEAPLAHQDFAGLLTFRPSNGRSGADVLQGRYPALVSADR